MFPEGISRTELEKIIANVKANKYPTPQHLAIAYGKGEQWLKDIRTAAKRDGLLPSYMTPTQWNDLFPNTRRMTPDEVQDQKKKKKAAHVKRRALLSEYRILHSCEPTLTPTSRQRLRELELELKLEHAKLAIHSAEYYSALYQFDDLSGEQKREAREKFSDRQKGVCAICKKPFSADRRPNLDHCHETGRIRGLLCTPCNYGLGFFKDSILSLENAIKYILDNSTIHLREESS